MDERDLIYYIQDHELLVKYFFFINKGFIRDILQKLKKGFYPESISMDDDGYVTIKNCIVEQDDFSKKQLNWFYSTGNYYIGGCDASFALIGCINRLKKEFIKEKNNER